MVLEPNGRAPYTSASAAVTALQAFRDRAPSGPVTTDMLVKLGVPESIAKRTLNSLEELDLIKADGQPTETLEAFKQTRGEEDYRARLQEWLRDVYADVLPYGNPGEDSIDQIQEAFRGYEPEGQRKAMASLLIGLWEYAGLPLAESTSAPANRPPRRQTSPSTRKRTTPKRTTGGHRHEVASDVSPGLLGMLRELPGSWTRDRRDAFLAAFTAMLDFTVPVVNHDQTDSQFSVDQEDSP